MADPIPQDYPRVSPYLCVDGAAAAIEFCDAHRRRLAGGDGCEGGKDDG